MTPPRPVSDRPAVAVFAGLAAAAAWLFATLAHQVIAAIGAGPLTAGLQPLLPATGPSWVAASSTPWQVLVPVAAALALGSMVFAGVPVVLRAARPGRVPAFVLAWACVVAASALLGALWAIGGIAVEWPPARWAFLFRDVQPQVGAGAYWGLVWGWIPAWAGATAARRSPDRTRARNPGNPGATVFLRLLPAVGFAVVLIAAIPLASAANRDAVTPSPAAEPAPAPVPIGQPAASYDIEDGAPGSANPAGGTWCTGEQVRTVLAGGDAATGHRVQQLRATNTSDAPCRLGTYPDMAFDDAGGNAMNVLFYRGGSFMTEDPGPSVVVLQPGATAIAELGWNAMAPAGATTPGTMLVAPYAGANRTRLAVNGDGDGRVLDIVDGGAVAITAWSAAG